MPELPEVETIVRELASALPGRRIRDVSVVHADLLVEAAGSFRRGIRGFTIRGVRRRGKNIVMDLDPGPPSIPSGTHPEPDPKAPGPSEVLAVNLGMTGRLLLAPSPAAGQEGASALSSHPGVVFHLDPGGSLVYDDVRRFGSLRRYTPRAWERESARLGPEPLDASLVSSHLHQRLQSSRSPIRSWLLDQTRIAGIGNIYALEALFRAGIHPRRPAGSLDAGEAKALLEAIRAVLREAVEARGTTLRDYRTATGDPGEFGSFLLVYGREGNPCSRCNAPIQRIVFGNRSAFFCPRCQTEG